MKGVEEVPVIEPKHGLKLPFRWKVTFAALMIAVLLLASVSTVQFFTLNEMDSLRAENRQLLSWGIGTNKVVNLLQNVAQIDTSKYTVTLLSNRLQYRQDFSVTEEIIKYSLTSSQTNHDVDFRFRDNHFSLYKLTLSEDSPIYTKTQASDILQIAQNTLDSYKAYSGDTYLDDMSNLLSQVNQTESTAITEGNLRLQITTSGNTAEFLWMYTAQGIDFSAKSLRMAFQNKVLTAMTDGYFLFTIGNTDLSITQDRAIQIAKDYAKTLTWNIDGQQVTGFTAIDPPISVELLPHPRANSVALIPYWYIVLRLDQTYSGGVSQISVGVFADTGQVVDVQVY